MLNKLKLRPALKQFERKEGEFRNPNVAEINALIDDINQELQNIPAAYTPPLIYAGKITQEIAGTNPTFSGGRNTIGNIVWERLSAGVFKGTVPVGVVITPENSYANVKLQIRAYGLETYADLVIQPNGEIYLQIYDGTFSAVDEFTAYIKIEIYQ